VNCDKNTPVGTKVKMVNCLEAEKYTGKIWTTESYPWQLGSGQWVVLIKGHRGVFSIECLETADEEPRLRVKKTSKITSKTIKNLDTASHLLHEIKVDLDKTAAMVKEIKQGPYMNITPIYKQEELFSFVVLPEENETLKRVCLGSLVETI
jgi:hypothetical protein